VTADRARGVVIYALAAVLLLAGGLWWFAAAPEESRSPLLAQWEATAQQLLPEVENQADSGMLTLSAGSERTIESNVGIGEFVVSVVCVGRESSRIRVSRAPTPAEVSAAATTSTRTPSACPWPARCACG
jgi:hypothetical protein